MSACRSHAPNPNPDCTACEIAQVEREIRNIESTTAPLYRRLEDLLAAAPVKAEEPTRIVTATTRDDVLEEAARIAESLVLMIYPASWSTGKAAEAHASSIAAKLRALKSAAPVKAEEPTRDTYRENMKKPECEREHCYHSAKGHIWEPSGELRNCFFCDCAGYQPAAPSVPKDAPRGNGPVAALLGLGEFGERDAWQNELNGLEREFHLCSLGDRPTSPGVAKLKRASELRSLLGSPFAPKDAPREEAKPEFDPERDDGEGGWYT